MKKYIFSFIVAVALSAESPADTHKLDCDKPAAAVQANSPDCPDGGTSGLESESSLQTSSALEWAIVIMSLAVIISTSAAFWLYRWRRIMFQKSGGDGEAKFAMPEEWIAKIKTAGENAEKLDGSLSQKVEHIESAIDGARRQFGEQLQDSKKSVHSNTQATLKKVQELFDSYLKLQGVLDEKDTEIKRLKVGYDKEIFRRFLYRFILIDETVGEYMKDPETPQEVKKILGDIQVFFKGALDECGVEKFSPKLEGDYRKEFGVADQPEVEATDDAGKHFMISEVLAEGYRLRSADDKGEAVVKAKVKIFKHQKQPEN